MKRRHISCSLGLAMVVSLGFATGALSKPLPPGVEADQRAQEYARCLISNRPGREAALGLLRSIPGSDEYASQIERVTSWGDCVPADTGGGFVLGGGAFRWALYTALYGVEFGATRPDPSRFPAETAFAAEYQSRRSKVPEGLLARRRFADCAVRRDPAAAHDMLTAGIWTPEETKAWPAVIRALNACAQYPLQGTLQRDFLRGIVAEAAYKLRKSAALSLAPQADAGKH